MADDRKAIVAELMGQGPHRQWHIRELAAEVGLAPRTIRYYLAEGFLPPVEFRGSATVYGQEHRLRLLALRHLRSQGYSLEQIKNALKFATAEELEALARPMNDPEALAEPEPELGPELGLGADLDDDLAAEPPAESAPEPPPAPTSAHREAPAGDVPGPALEPAHAVALEAPAAPTAAAGAAVQAAGAAVQATGVAVQATGAAAAPTLAEGAGLEGERWQRIALLPGLELHVRAGAGALIERLAREIIERYRVG